MRIFIRVVTSSTRSSLSTRPSRSATSCPSGRIAGRRLVEALGFIGQKETGTLPTKMVSVCKMFVFKY